MLHLFPHWNWAGKEDEEIEVWCHTNLDNVELFLNGKSLGAKSIQRNSHLEWKVKYAPGIIEARGTRKGRVLLSAKRETTGAPEQIVLRPDRQKIAADGADVSVITVEVVDARGRTVPTASNQISFKLSGGGRLIGMGNGDPSCHEPDKPTSFTEGQRSAFNGLCMALVQSLKESGEVRLLASSPGLRTTSVVIQAS